MAWYPSAARWMSASSSPSASTKACAISSKPYPRRTGRPSPTGWTAPPMWPRPPTLPLRVKPTPGSQLALFATYSYAAVLLPRRTAHPLGAPPHPAASQALALGSPVQPRQGAAASDSTSCLTATPVSEPSIGQPNVPANSRPPGLRETLAVSYPAISLATATAGRHRCPQKRLQTAHQPPVYPNSSPDHRACNSLTPFHCPRAVYLRSRGQEPPLCLSSAGAGAVNRLGEVPAAPVTPLPPSTVLAVYLRSAEAKNRRSAYPALALGRLTDWGRCQQGRP